MAAFLYGKNVRGARKEGGSMNWEAHAKNNNLKRFDISKLSLKPVNSRT